MFDSVALRHFFGIFKVNFGEFRTYPAAHTVCLVVVGVAGMGFYFRARWREERGGGVHQTKKTDPLHSPAWLSGDQNQRVGVFIYGTWLFLGKRCVCRLVWEVDQGSSVFIGSLIDHGERKGGGGERGPQMRSWKVSFAIFIVVSGVPFGRSKLARNFVKE